MKCRIKVLAAAQRHRRRLDLQHPPLPFFRWSCWSVFFFFYHHRSALFLSRRLNSVVISPSLICSATFWSALRRLPLHLSFSLLTSSSKEGPPTKYPPSPPSSISLQLFLSGGYSGFPSDTLSVSHFLSPSFILFPLSFSLSLSLSLLQLLLSASLPS